MKRGLFVIYVKIKTPRVTIDNSFDLADYESPKEHIKAVKDWIRKKGRRGLDDRCPDIAGHS